MLPLRKQLLVVITITTAITAGHPCAAALLEGRFVNVYLNRRPTPADESYLIDEGPVLVGPGVERTNFGFHQNPDFAALVDIDLSDTSILITLVGEQTNFFSDSLEFLDVNNNLPPISGITVNPATNWGVFTAARLGGSSTEVIFVQLAQLSGLVGQKIVLDLVPEPGACTLGFAGAIALIARRRTTATGRCRPIA